MSKARRLTVSLVAVLLGSVALTACGSSSTKSSSTAATSTTSSSATSTSSSSSSTSSNGAAQLLSLEANRTGELKYNKSSLTASAGKVSIALTNMSPLEHNVTIEDSSGKILGATPTFKGGTETLSLELKPGTYKFFCSVPGHRMAGMEGTLTVR